MKKVVSGDLAMALLKSQKTVGLRASAGSRIVLNKLTGAPLALFLLLVLGCLCWQTKALAVQLDEADLQFREALQAYEKNPSDHRCVYNLAALTSRLGDREQALPLFEKAVQLDGDDFYSHLGLCQSLAIEYLLDKKDGVAQALQSEQTWNRVLNELTIAETLLWQDRRLSGERRLEALILLCKTEMQLHQFDKVLSLLQKVQAQEQSFGDGSYSELKEFELLCRFAAISESKSGPSPESQAKLYAKSDAKSYAKSNAEFYTKAYLNLGSQSKKEIDSLAALAIEILSADRKIKSAETLRVVLGGIVPLVSQQQNQDKLLAPLQAKSKERPGLGRREAETIMRAETKSRAKSQSQSKSKSKSQSQSAAPYAKLLALAARQIERSFPDDASLWLLLARLEDAAAEKHYRRALALKKESLAANLGLTLVLSRRNLSAARAQLKSFEKILAGREPGPEVVIAGKATSMALSLLPKAKANSNSKFSFGAGTTSSGAAFAVPLKIVRLDCGCSLGAALLQLSQRSDLGYIGLQARQGGRGLLIFTVPKAALGFSQYKGQDLEISALVPGKSGFRRIADFSELADSILTFEAAFYLPALELGNADFPSLPLAI
jgi:tetratricopeptide (TPR) repeat protein